MVGWFVGIGVLVVVAVGWCCVIVGGHDPDTAAMQRYDRQRRGFGGR